MNGDSGKNSAPGPKPTGFKVEPLELADIDTIATIFFAAYTSPWEKRMFPNTPSTRQWWYDVNLDAFSNDPTVRFLKVVDPAAGGKMIAWAKWVVPAHTVTAAAAQGDKLEDRWAGPPADSDPAAVEFFFETLETQRKALMGDRPHYYADQEWKVIEMIGTLPEYQGRGEGSALLRWGCDQADREGLETYLDGSPGALKLYEKFGFEAKSRVPMPDDSGENYVETFMIRQPRSV